MPKPLGVLDEYKGGETSLFNLVQPGRHDCEQAAEDKDESCVSTSRTQYTKLQDGKMDAPSRAQSARWVAEAEDDIRRRTKVRAFVACHISEPEDYSADERRGLME
eukprot:5791524-Prymnesium_polylepis.1